LGVIGWLLAEYVVYKKPTLIGGASGAVAGLVAITPASGSAGMTDALIIGLVGGILGFIGVAKLKKMFKVDDSLDAFWVHGLVGIWGSIATAIFIASYAMPEDYNMGSQLMAQIKAILLTIVYSGIMTAVVYFIASMITGGGRVDEETEQKGLDESVHSEKAMHL
jgi:Amt family ammonium transporter